MPNNSLIIAGRFIIYLYEKGLRKRRISPDGLVLRFSN
jgi:hypothetical protein